MTDFTPTPASQPQIPTFTEPEKKPGFFKRHWPLFAVGVLGLVIGGLAGGAGGSDTNAEPAPAKTITVTEPAAAEDDGCQAVAIELWDMLSTTVNEVVIPQQEVGQVLLDNLLEGFDIASIEAATAKIQTYTAVTTDLTARTEAVSPDYVACAG